MKVIDMQASYAGACASPDAPLQASRASAEIHAEIVGPVRYRQGDGVLLEICPGPIRVVVCGRDAVFSWVEDRRRWNVAMPLSEFGRYVDEGVIRVLADAPGDVLAPISLEPSSKMERTMSQRLDYYKASKEATNAMLGLEKAVSQFGLEPTLLELVRLRASQINTCAYCVDYHIAAAKKAGETDRRLQLVVVWRESPFFTPRERAALAWTESLTRLPDTGAPDEHYALVREQFSDKEIVDLTVAIIAVNGWNRLGVGFRRSPE
jgi:AhpD family alkylhydroperoxidase